MREFTAWSMRPGWPEACSDTSPGIMLELALAWLAPPNTISIAKNSFPGRCFLAMSALLSILLNLLSRAEFFHRGYQP